MVGGKYEFWKGRNAIWVILHNRLPIMGTIDSRKEKQFLLRDMPSMLMWKYKLWAQTSSG